MRRHGHVVRDGPAPVPVQDRGGPAGLERPGATRVRPAHERRVHAHVVEPVGDEAQVTPGVGRQLVARRRRRRRRRPVDGVRGHQVGRGDAVRGVRAAPVAAVRLAFGRRRLSLADVVVLAGEVAVDRRRLTGRRGGRRRKRRRVELLVADRQVRLADVHHRVVHRPRLEERVPHELEERYDDEREHALEERERLGEPLERLGGRGAADRRRVVAVRVEHRLPFAGVLGRAAGRRRRARRVRRSRCRRGRPAAVAGHVHAVRLPPVPTGHVFVAHHAGAFPVRL